MGPKTATPATAGDVLRAVLPFGPAADGEDLVFAADPPADLVGVLGVLHTGVRALLQGKIWYGCDGATGRVAELNPAAPLPAGVTLVCVAGDARWDRVDPAARLDHPRLFDRPPAAGPSRPRPASASLRELW